MEQAFHLYNSFAKDGISLALEKHFSAPPVVLCIGSDLAIGDSLGPLVGSMIRHKTQGIHPFVYGTLSSPVTAKEIKYMRGFLKATHPRSPILAIDAAVGNSGDIGLIKIAPTPLLPGAGANKKLGKIGDFSLIGIVAEKSLGNYALFHQTRVHLIYSMADIISDGVASFLWQNHKKIIV